MWYVLLYFVIGLAWTFLFRTEDDNFAFFDTSVCLLLILFWPPIIFYMATKMKRIKWRGKVLWEKK
jgi:hypothetical protein